MWHVLAAYVTETPLARTKSDGKERIGAGRKGENAESKTVALVVCQAIGIGMQRLIVLL